MENGSDVNFEKNLLQVLRCINLRLGEIRDQLAEMNGYIVDDFDEDELKSRAALIVTDNGEEISAGIMRKPLIYFGGEGGYDFGERAESAYKLADLLCGHLKDGVHQSEEKTRAADEFFGRAELGYKREIYNEIIIWLCENGEIDSYEDFEVADSYEDED